MAIVGLDLAGVENRPTDFCLLTGMTAETRLVYTDTEILEKTAQSNPRVVAIDAPLCLPPGRKSIEEKTSTHLRESDRALLKMGIKPFPITLGPMRKLTVRGIHLKNILETQNFTVIEAYPGDAQDVLGIPNKTTRAQEVESGFRKIRHTRFKQPDKRPRT
jgi:predicted nuclease with RNAse H fold